MIRKVYSFIFFCLGVLSCISSVHAQKRTGIVMLMPFSSKKILANPNHSDAQLGVLSREYYQGAMIAADSLEHASLTVNLSVFDTENDSLVLVSILKKQTLRDAGLILGPILAGGNKVMTDFVKGKDVYHVSPLMTLSKTKLNDPNFISANPDLPFYARYILQFIRNERKDSAQIIVVSDKSGLDKTISAAIKQWAAQNKTVKIKFVDFVKGMNMQNSLSKTLTNHIIIPSSNENTVSAALKSIKDTAVFSGVNVYGFPQWLDFKNPDYILWQQANVRIATPFFIDYTREDVKSFITAYRERFYTEPSEAAFKGYDQLLFFAKHFQADGKKLMARAEGNPQKMLHTVFDFKKQDDKSGYQNGYLNIIGIEGLRFVQLNK
ncbi:MAG: hypothetical protein V4651_06250 [Bacteroidota bacterium]